MLDEIINYVQSLHNQVEVILYILVSKKKVEKKSTTKRTLN